MLRGDATRLPLAPGSLDLVVAFDVLEHIEDDKAAATGVFEALRPGGTFLVAVPADPRLWSAHDVAVGHVRRYTRPELLDLLRVPASRSPRCAAGWCCCGPPWPCAAGTSSPAATSTTRRRGSTPPSGRSSPLERVLPVGRLPGVSLLVRARRY